MAGYLFNMLGSGWVPSCGRGGCIDSERSVVFVPLCIEPPRPSFLSKRAGSTASDLVASDPGLTMTDYPLEKTVELASKKMHGTLGFLLTSDYYAK